MLPHISANPHWVQPSMLMHKAIQGQHACLIARPLMSACPLVVVAGIAQFASTEPALWIGAALYGALLISSRHGRPVVKAFEIAAGIACCCLALVNVGGVQ